MSSLVNIFVLLLLTSLHFSTAKLHTYTYKTTFLDGPELPYIRLDSTISQPLRELTLCYWAKPHNNTQNSAKNISLTVFSYGTTKRHDELLSALMMNEENGTVIFHRQTKTETFKTLKKYSPYITMGSWVHICFVWSSYAGSYKIYINGRPHYYATGLAKGESVESGGMVILGQDQDYWGGSFDRDESFKGDISELHLWDYEFLAHEVLEVYNCNQSHEGNILSWMKAGKIFRGGVLMTTAHLPCGKN